MNTSGLSFNRGQTAQSVNVYERGPVHIRENVADNDTTFMTQNVRMPKHFKQPKTELEFSMFVPKSQPSPIPQTLLNVDAVDSKSFARIHRKK